MERIFFLGKWTQYYATLYLNQTSFSSSNDAETFLVTLPLGAVCDTGSPILPLYFLPERVDGGRNIGQI